MKKKLATVFILASIFLHGEEVQKDNSSSNEAKQISSSKDLVATFSRYANDPSSLENALALYQMEMDVDRLIVMQSLIAFFPYEKREKFFVLIASKCKYLFLNYESLSQDQKELFFDLLKLNLSRSNDEIGKIALEFFDKFPLYKFPAKLEISNIGYRDVEESEMKGLQGACIALSYSNFDVKQFDVWVEKYNSDSVSEDTKLLILWGMGFSPQHKCLKFLASLNPNSLDERGKIIREMALKRVSMRIENFHNNIFKNHTQDGKFSGKISGIDSNEEKIIKFKADLDKNWDSIVVLVEKFSKLNVEPISSIYPVW